MKTSYVLLGAAFLVIVGAAFYFAPSRDAANPNDTMKTALTLTSSAFPNGGTIPATYTCDGDNTSPPLQIAGVPEEAVSLVLIMDDPDVPTAVKPDGVFDHWVVYNIPPSTTEIKAGETAGVEGLNGRGDTGYVGSCPPPEYEPTEHRYFFKLYALDKMLAFETAPGKSDVLAAIAGHVIAETELVGRYERVKQ